MNGFFEPWSRGRSITLGELDAAVGRYITAGYHPRAHAETRQPPVTRWASGGWIPRLPESLEQLDLLLLTVARARTVHRDGIRFQGLRYLDLTLAAYADAGDRAAVATLAPFLEWMAAAHNPASMLRWMQTPTFWVTRDLIDGGIDVSHAGLDGVAPRAPQAVGFVRAQGRLLPNSEDGRVGQHHHRRW